MDKLRCLQMRQSKFIERNVVFDIRLDEITQKHETILGIKPEFASLGIAFSKYKVESKFVYEKDPATNRPKRTRDHVTLDTVKDQIREFCETNLDGYWSWKMRRVLSSNGDHIYILEVFFETQDDLNLFLKECGVLIKMAN